MPIERGTRIDIENKKIRLFLHWVENTRNTDLDLSIVLYLSLIHILDGITMNVEMADYGLENKAGIGVGFGIKKAKEEGYMADDLMTEAMMLTAAASDARMAGIKMPVMSSNGSGNLSLIHI